MKRGAGLTLLLTVLALCGFASNSLLCRAALGGHRIDAASFTVVRLAAGALLLSLLVAAGRGGRSAATGRREGLFQAGSLGGGIALLAYAACFSYAYLRLSAGTGALVLFAAVQATMIGVGIARGERPGARRWLGMAVAAIGIVMLSRPGLAAPDPWAAVLMAAAGAAWGVYSVLGLGARRPLAATAANFLRALLLAAPLAGLALARGHAGAAGLVLAAASGALASGVGYALWYAALEGLTATRAAVVQLAVPVLAAAGGVVLLGEPLTLRLGLASVLVLGGMALFVLGRHRAP